MTTWQRIVPFCAVLLLFFLPLKGQKSTLSKAGWTEEKIAKGLVWKRLHTDQLFQSWQHLNMLEIRKSRKISLAFAQDSLIKTSTFARRDSAMAAINGGFFNMKQGGSVTYLKADWKVIAHHDSALIARKSEILEGAFIITDDRWVQIETARPERYYNIADDVRSVLITGPMLLEDGRPSPLDQTAFNDNRHPRTCACLTEKNRLLLLTADGRNAQAAGLSLPELTQLLLDLGCRQAINLDGGGSTTMYIQQKPDNGVVNMPSDNRLFDHLGERSVANVILVY